MCLGLSNTSPRSSADAGDSSQPPRPRAASKSTKTAKHDNSDVINTYGISDQGWLIPNLPDRKRTKKGHIELEER